MKIYDIVAVIGEYKTKENVLKNRYKTVGEMHETTSRNGEVNQFLLLDKSFNLMAVKQKNLNDEKVILSLYRPKEKENQSGTVDQTAGTPTPTGQAHQVFDDEIPF